MKKAKFAAMILALSFMISGCQNTAKSVSLYDKGLEIVHDMEDLVKSDVYSHIYGSVEIQKVQKV